MARWEIKSRVFGWMPADPIIAAHAVNNGLPCRLIDDPHDHDHQAYEDGYRDGSEGLRPEVPSNESYMQGWRKGKPLAEM